MNRGAAVGFLVLAALVGGTASLRESDYAAIGQQLLAVQSDIDAHSTYTPLPRLQTANARLAFFGEMDYFPYDSDYQIQPQTSQYFDIPQDQYYNAGDPDNIGIYTTPSSGAYPTYDWGDPDGYGVMVTPSGTAYPTYDWGGDPDGYGVLVSPNGTEYPTYDWGGDPDGYGVLVTPSGGEYPSYNWDDADGYGVIVTPTGTPYPQVTAPSRGGSNPSNAPRIANNSHSAADPRTYAPSLYEIMTYTPSMYEVTSYTPNSYGIGGVGGYGYQPTWYERTFPGFGSAVIPLLPSQYRPGHGNDCYGANGPTIGGALSVFDDGFGISLGLGLGNNNYPCYGGYSPYLSVAPTYYDSAGGSGNSRVLPTCSISLADSSIEYGRSAVISWSSQGATSAFLNGIGSVPLSGSRSLPNQTASRTIGITVTGPGGTGACYAALSVNTNQPPTCQISANPSVIKKGETANLAWVSTNASEASLSGLGTVPVQSGRVVSPASDTTFTLRVKNAANLTATCSVKVDVQ